MDIITVGKWAMKFVDEEDRSAYDHRRDVAVVDGLLAISQVLTYVIGALRSLEQTIRECS